MTLETFAHSATPSMASRAWPALAGCAAILLGIALLAATAYLREQKAAALQGHHALKAELAHNLAIAFWISANSYWMISEFFGFDEVHIWRHFEGKHLAIIPFAIGALILAFYYLVQKPRESRQEAAMATL